MQTQSIVTTTTSDYKPTAIERKDKNGKVTGSVIKFVGADNAKSLREQGKAAGIKGKALTGFVNSMLTGDKGKAAWLKGAAMFQIIQGEGKLVPTQFVMNKAGDGGRMEFIAPTVSPADESLTKELEALRAELAALKAKQA